MQPSKWKSFPQIGRKCSSETNIFAPENGWLEYYPFLLGFGLFSGAMLVSGSVAIVSLSLSLCLWSFPETAATWHAGKRFPQSRTSSPYRSCEMKDLEMDTMFCAL